jgi:excisionase family DNA binding protein
MTERTSARPVANHRPLLLTISAVAERLAVSARQVRRWIAEGKLPAHHFGRLVRIGEADLQLFLASHRRDGGRL